MAQGQLIFDLNEDTCQWQSPIPYPQDNNKYNWNEETLSWDIIEL